MRDRRAGAIGERDIMTGTRSTGVGRVGGGGWERGVGSRFAIVRVVN